MTEQIFDKRPIYNIRSVLRETGIKEDTLRAWERRYDLPKPERSPGGHRLFSRYDIETIKWLQERVNEGVRISQAVEMWRRNELAQERVRPVVDETSNTFQPNVYDDLRARWVEACLRFDPRSAEAVIRQGFAIMPALRVCDQIMLSGLVQIGDLWYEDKASVQQEHFASELVVRQIQSLISAAPPPYRDHTILIGTPRDELHVIALLYIALLLRDHGYSVIYLGANIPLEEMAETINKTRPSLVISSISEITHLPGLLGFSELIRRNGVKFAFGGRVFVDHPLLVEKIPGHYLGVDLENLIHSVDEVIRSSKPSANEIVKIESDIELADLLAQARPDIYGKLASTITDQIPRLRDKSLFDQIFDHFTQVILVSVKLNYIDLIDGEIDWARGLIEKHQIQGGAIDKFVMSYAKAVEELIGERASLLAIVIKSSVTDRT